MLPFSCSHVAIRQAIWFASRLVLTTYLTRLLSLCFGLTPSKNSVLLDFSITVEAASLCNGCASLPRLLPESIRR